MSPGFIRASLAGCSVIVLALCLSGPTHAQQDDQSSSADGGATALPEVVVRAPSPIVRRRPHRAAAGGTAPAANPAPAPAEPAPDTAALPGTLPIVTDQFATVTVVPNGEL